MGTVFDLFSCVKYQYVEIDRGTVEGNKISGAVEHEGVFKFRGGMVQGDREVSKSDATLHVHPEDYKSPEGLVGNGIVYGGVTYRISGVTVGQNYDGGAPEFYRLTLENEQLVEEGF